MPDTHIAVGQVALDLTHRIVANHAAHPPQTAHLSLAMMRLLDALMQQPGRILAEGRLMEAMYPNPDDEPGSPNILHVQMRNLRCRLGEIGLGDFVRTARHEGYYVEGTATEVRLLTRDQAALVDAVLARAP